MGLTSAEESLPASPDPPRPPNTEDAFLANPVCAVKGNATLLPTYASQDAGYTQRVNEGMNDHPPTFSSQEQPLQRHLHLTPGVADLSVKHVTNPSGEHSGGESMAPRTKKRPLCTVPLDAATLRETAHQTTALNKIGETVTFDEATPGAASTPINT